MKVFTIIAGVNGVGKAVLQALHSSGNDIGVVIAEELPENKSIESAIEEGISFALETTLSGTRTLRIIKQARERDYRIWLYYVGANTDEEDIKRFGDLLALLPYCDEAVFLDNENGFVECAEYKNARLYVKTENPSQWLNELIKYRVIKGLSDML